MGSHATRDDRAHAAFLRFPDVGPNRKLRELWHDRRLVLDDGRTLSWVTMTNIKPHRVECFVVDGQPVHHSVGVRALVAAGHPDAQLASPGETAYGPGRVSP